MDLFSLPPKPEPRGLRLPEDWSPSPESRRFAKGLGLDPATIADQFRDYWIAIPGQRGRKADWAATWRVWCRKEAERASQQASRPAGRYGPPNAAPLPLAADENLWWLRVKDWKPGKWWSPMWGPRPDQPHCHVPGAILERWRAL